MLYLTDCTVLIHIVCVGCIPRCARFRRKGPVKGKGMKLRPVIASYSSESSAAIRRYLDESVLDIVANIARSPKNSSEIARDVLAELVEMHVSKEQTGIVRLDTSVFLRNDIKYISDTVTPLAKKLCQRILEYGYAFRNAPPEIIAFLGGIIGLVKDWV